MNRYAMEIFYSEEDEGFIALAPELPGCSAFGKDEEEALKELKGAIGLWIRTARKEGRRIPTPSRRELPARPAVTRRRRNGRVYQTG